MQNVIHIISSGGLYGAERSILGLIKSVNRYSHRVVCFEKQSGAQQTFVDALNKAEITVTVIPDGYMDLRKNAKQIAKMADPNTPLCLHAHGYKGTLTSSFVKSIAKNTRVISTQHGFTNKSFKTRTFTRLETQLIKSTTINHVICVSSAIKDFYLNAKVAGTKLSYVSNSVEAPELSDAAFSDKNRDIDFLYLGRLSPEKGPDILIEALAALKEKNVNPRTVIAGDGPLMEDLKHRAETLGLSKSIEFSGFVTNPALLLARAKWLVMPSRTEGLPMSALEAMAIPTPLIATSVGELPSVLKNQKGGMLVPPENVLEFATAMGAALQKSTLEWSQTAKEAREKVEKDYALSRYGQEIAAIYDRVFASEASVTNRAEASLADQ